MEPRLDTVQADDEDVVRPLTDRDHLSTFGWAWDDPDHVDAHDFELGSL